MNEFTKEELQSLLKAYNMDPFYVDQKVDNFGARLQSLIDNYCEHKWIPHRIEDVILYWCIKCDASPRTTI